MRSVDNNAWNTWWDLSQIMLTKSNEERKKTAHSSNIEAKIFRLFEAACVHVAP